MRGRRLEEAKRIAAKKFLRKYGKGEWWLETARIHALRIMRKTGTPCSCVSCGNPRKWFGLKTRQELKADSSEKVLENGK